MKKIHDLPGLGTKGTPDDAVICDRCHDTINCFDAHGLHGKTLCTDCYADACDHIHDMARDREYNRGWL